MKYKSLAELFNTSKRWTIGVFARNKREDNVDLHSDGAVCWCLVGGARLVYTGTPDGVIPVYARLAKAIRKLFPHRVKGRMSPDSVCTGFNDNRNTTFRDLRRVIKEANV